MLNQLIWKTHNTEFHEIIMTFANQNGKLLEIEYKANLTLLINEQKWHVIL